MTCFIHTADWQLGKPFANIGDQHKRSLVQQARIDVLKRISHLVKEHQASFVLVAGDLFDTNSPDKSTVATACGAIGRMEVPVIVIPGNHDHAGAGSIWEQEFFQREQSALAPNLHILLDSKALELDDAVIYPCPLQRRSEAVDPTAWLRDSDVLQAGAANKPRVVMAHGSTQAFISVDDDDESMGMTSNRINIDRLPIGEIDYIALGDWHGTKQVGTKAWYSGTPEIDHFPKGEDNHPGQTLIVKTQRGESPIVEVVATGRLNWLETTFDFSNDDSIDQFSCQMSELFGQRTNEDLLKLTLTGSLGIEATSQLEALLESFEARLLRLKLKNNTAIAPSEVELDQLTRSTYDPLIASVAQQLVDFDNQPDSESAAIASLALRMLYSAAHRDVRS
ncbi:MAG: metallophosphoesterase family protein [Methylomicrobium sp.]